MHTYTFHAYRFTCSWFEIGDDTAFKMLYLFFNLFVIVFSSRGDEANKNFSYAIQMNDDGYRVWAHYGDFVESIFKENSPAQ